MTEEQNEIKPLRIWTVFKNTDNTVEGIEAYSFAMQQSALHEIEKEGDHIILMSADTMNLIRQKQLDLQQEKKELEEKIENYKMYGSSTVVQPVNHTNIEFDLIANQNELYKQLIAYAKEILEYYANSWIDPKTYPDLKYDNEKAKQAIEIINKSIVDDSVYKEEE